MRVPWKVSYFLSSRLGITPDFLIPGFAKCGTTSLFNYLSNHPDVYPPSGKELWFFSNPRDENELAHLRGYRRHFPTVFRKHYVTRILKRPFLTGEATPDYLSSHPKAIKLIAQFLPAAKFIVLVRNPVERTHSYYQHECRSGREKRTFHEVLQSELKMLEIANGKTLYTREIYDNRRQRDSYLIGSMYINYLEPLFRTFHRDQILVVKSEHLFCESRKTFEQILNFLGLEYTYCGEEQVHNRGRYKVDAIPEAAFLRKYLKPFNERLYSMLGVDFGWH